MLCILMQPPAKFPPYSNGTFILIYTFKYLIFISAYLQNYVINFTKNKSLYLGEDLGLTILKKERRKKNVKQLEFYFIYLFYV